jgi:NADPH-dependent 2,4-dienoyl-CoA reductase/sulfur reductase-like enzyme
MDELIIIGNGITGTTVARHVRKRSDRPITVISSEYPYLFSRPALMYVYMGHMRFEHTKPYEDWFWARNRIERMFDHVESIDTDRKTLRLRQGGERPYGTLVIATGATTQKFGWPGQDLPGVQGLVSKQDLDLMEENTRHVRHAVIVGGGLIGIEMAEMLTTRNIPVTFLVREAFYWDNILPKEEARIITRHVYEHGIDLRLSTQLKEILPGPDGRVRAVVTDKAEEIACELVGVTTGVRPVIDVVKGSKIEANRGILVNEYLETNVPDVYAAGDCAEFRTPRPRHPKVEQLWYTGRMQAETLARTLCGDRTAYDRGIWFNSAKFFDIEYQTYGFVSNIPLPDEDSLFWEHEDHKHSIRIVYLAKSEEVIGFNLLGVRYRQDVCRRWIQEKRTVRYVLEHLGEANFDPEFFGEMEPAVVEAFNRQSSGSPVQLNRRRGLTSLTPA